MRVSWRFALLSAALTFLLALPCGAASHTASSFSDSSRTTKTVPHARVPVEERPFGATCRTRVDGSYVTAYCHNPYPEPDHVRLHIECDRWWDIDTDAPRVEAGPAQTVRLTGRCWKEVRAAWVGHQK